jgi:large subunit ribosomal protein L22
MEAVTIQKNIHQTPRKMRLVIDMIRKMEPMQAVKILQFTNKSAAEPILKAIQTVLANSKAKNLEVEKMVFKSIEINEGLKVKRYRAGTKGRAKPYRKRMSQIKIVLTDEVKEVKSQKLKVKSNKLTEKKKGLENGKKD